MRSPIPELIAPADLWTYTQQAPLLDVRSPGEYRQGHIPGAISFPLFSDAERAEVGTIYKQLDPRQALLRGLEYVGPKMADFVRQADQLLPQRCAVVHCWRGGQRSGAMAWLLRQAGFQIAVLQGGYKGYRQHIHKQYNELPWDFWVLGGRTGSGKTQVLRYLTQHHHAQVLDLEQLVHHKGSAFGALGEEAQPSTEQADNDIFDALQAMDVHRKIWVENESRTIGKVYLPDGLWARMQAGKLVELQLPLEERIKLLVRQYTAYPLDALREAFTRLRKRLGGQHVKAALEALDREDYHEAAAIALVYYDKAYDHFLERQSFEEHLVLSFDTFDPAVIAVALDDI